MPTYIGRLLSISVIALLNSGISTKDSDAKEDDPYMHVSEFEHVQNLAESLSQRPYEPVQPPPEPLAELNYERYRKIHFKPNDAVWWGGDVPYCLETFHQGFVQRNRVRLFTINDNQTSEVAFASTNFSYGDLQFDPKTLSEAGHAGIKIAGKFPYLNDAQEMLTFLGSSYFRARSAETLYGVSARGLAVDVGLLKDEEFPSFRSFWVVQPKLPSDPESNGSADFRTTIASEVQPLTILALMDSPSVSGAYQFTLQPGNAETKIDVASVLYFRVIPEKIGIAPMTSMWIWGDGLKGPAVDDRPSVHDSDGLLFKTSAGEWTWRPFARQGYPSVIRYPVVGLAGFGLLQRNQAFYHFNDHNAQYHKRPSVWIEPNADWGRGSIELLELPGAHEGIDNIAAYWIPEQTPEPGTPYRLDYRVRFFGGDLAEHDFLARATNFTVDRLPERISMTVRFSGEALRPMTSGTLEVDASLIRGELISQKTIRTSSGDWLVDIMFAPTEAAPVEVRLVLRDSNRHVSETFRYLCPEKEPTFSYPQVLTRTD